jgi:D-3-phosphoglycerate dehydrogenase
LLAHLADAAAVIVRSATTLDAEAIAAAPRLKVIARAGVGVDNIDVPAASAAGVTVVNAPTANVLSAAEHTVGLLLACARNIPAADASLRSGSWQRSRFTGVELAGKTVGIVGLGRVGALVAERLRAFGVQLLAFDPYLEPVRAEQLGAYLVGLRELMSQSDFITVHLPRTPETIGLIGEEELRWAKPTVRVVNAARGGVIDETALAIALKEGRIAGAAVDVFDTEPCTESPLFDFGNVVVTPHLGASTEEAQERAGLAVAASVLLALSGQPAPGLVNAGGAQPRPLVSAGSHLGLGPGQ